MEIDQVYETLKMAVDILAVWYRQNSGAPLGGMANHLHD
jgi:hypothetical protein